MISQQNFINFVVALPLSGLSNALAHVSKEKLGSSSLNFPFALCAIASGIARGIFGDSVIK